MRAPQFDFLREACQRRSQVHSSRLKAGERWGPVREIHGGSGYWSQDSAVPIMAMPGEATEVWVRWPGGKMATNSVPNGAREVAVNFDGTVIRAK